MSDKKIIKQEQNNEQDLSENVLQCSCFQANQHIALVEIADFILDAKATKRFIRKVSLWAGVIFAYWSVENYVELFAWMKTILP